jgi:hypothetical protein
MAGLDPAIHDFDGAARDMDGRIKSGHDGNYEHAKNNGEGKD